MYKIKLNTEEVAYLKELIVKKGNEPFETPDFLDEMRKKFGEEIWPFQIAYELVMMFYDGKLFNVVGANKHWQYKVEKNTKL